MSPNDVAGALAQFPQLALFMLSAYFVIRVWSAEQAAQREYYQRRDDKYQELLEKNSAALIGFSEKYLAALVELSKMNHQSMSEAAKDAFDEALERVVTERMSRDFERDKKRIKNSDE